MPLSLSPDDRQHLEAVQRALLAPLDHADADAWRRVVNRELKALMEADTATFILPVRTGHVLFSEEITPVQPISMAAYLELVRPLNAHVPLWKRVAEQGVHDSASLFAPCRQAYLRSAYYNELKRPLRLFHTTGMSMLWGEEPREDRLAQLTVHRDRPEAPSFGRRGITIMRLLYPAFQAGVAMWLRFQRHRATFLRTLDVTGQMLQLGDLAGRVRHRTPALAEALAQEPQRARLEAEMARIARCLVDLGHGRRRDEVIPRPAGAEVQTARAHYRIRGSYVDGPHLESDSLVLITLERGLPALPSPQTLRERFDLTRRQAQVALLVAQGKQNTEIAEVLGISPNTARRHTEKVREKLAVHSRAEVAYRILQEE